MVPPQKTRELARSLVASEVDESGTALQPNAATVRVYEKLRRQLGAPVGLDSFQVLASRALALAKSQSPNLDAVQVMAHGELFGLDDAEAQTGSAGSTEEEAGVILIGQLLEMFLAFLGETTTLRLIADLRLQADPEVDSLVATVVDGAASSVEEPAMNPAFEDLLLEIDRLRSVSNHIEALAYHHSDMEQGLENVVRNIRNIATVLDIFTLIRSKAGGPQDETPDLQTNLYMN